MQEHLLHLFLLALAATAVEIAQAGSNTENYFSDVTTRERISISSQTGNWQEQSLL
jgi:hypothetical protein